MKTPLPDGTPSRDSFVKTLFAPPLIIFSSASMTTTGRSWSSSKSTSNLGLLRQPLAVEPCSHPHIIVGMQSAGVTGDLWILTPLGHEQYIFWQATPIQQQQQQRNTKDEIVSPSPTHPRIGNDFVLYIATDDIGEFFRVGCFRGGDDCVVNVLVCVGGRNGVMMPGIDG